MPPLKRLKTEVKNVPEVYDGRGSLLDIVVHPDYALKMVGFTSPYASRKAEERWKY
jgi:F420-dependent methylenetetrahydromethanopterin dehydrogenase